MSLIAIKEKFEEKIAQLGSKEECPIPGIGRKKLSVAYKGEKFALEKTNHIYRNHIVVSLSSSLFFSRREWNENNTVDTFKRVYLAMVDYWVGYAREKKRDGLIVVSDNKFGESFNLDGNLNEEQWELMDFVIRTDVSPGGFRCAHLSEEFKERVNDALTAIGVVGRVMDERKVLGVADKQYNDLRHLYSREIPFFYKGEELQISMQYPEEARGLRLRIRMDEKERIIEPTVSALSNILDGIEEERLLVNLVENPMHNFLAFVDEAASRFYPFAYWSGEFENDNKDVQKREFSLLCEELGSWQVVEEEFAELRSKRLEVLINWQDDKTGSGMNVYRGSTQRNTFYFLILRGGVEKKEENKGIIKVVNIPEDKTALEKLMASMLLKDLF